jgi:hypothetical protein
MRNTEKIIIEKFDKLSLESQKKVNQFVKFIKWQESKK